jgi:(heptosyl)LPS beta-1,4-glucosyltransferase
VYRLIGVILTKNEAHHISDCVAALRPWVEAVVVWDSGSSDGTPALAQQAGALVVTRPFDNYAAQRQAALDALAAEWVLFVDADERVTPALAQEVQHKITQGTANGYWVPRRNWIVGREIRHGGYFPDYQLRLVRRAATHYDLAREVHELAHVEGAAGYLQEPLIHYNYEDWAQFHHKQRAYAAYEARILQGRGVRPLPHRFVLQPLREFRRRFVALQGWRDGESGLRLALLFAWYYGVMPYWLLLKNGGKSVTTKTQ